MSAIATTEVDLKSGGSVGQTEEGLRNGLSNDEEVLARFGKRQQLRVSFQRRLREDQMAHWPPRGFSDLYPQLD